MGFELKYQGKTIAYATNERVESESFVGPNGRPMRVVAWDNTPLKNSRDTSDVTTGFIAYEQGVYYCGKSYEVPTGYNVDTIRNQKNPRDVDFTVILTDTRPRTPAPQIGKK